MSVFIYLLLFFFCFVLDCVIGTVHTVNNSEFNEMNCSDQSSSITFNQMAQLVEHLTWNAGFVGYNLGLVSCIFSLPITFMAVAYHWDWKVKMQGHLWRVRGGDAIVSPDSSIGLYISDCMTGNSGDLGSNPVLILLYILPSKDTEQILI